MLLVTLADERPWADRGSSHRLLLARRGQRTLTLTEEPLSQVIHRDAVLILPQRLIAHRPPARVTAEIRPDQQRAMRPGHHRREPSMPAPGTCAFSYAAWRSVGWADILGVR